MIELTTLRPHTAPSSSFTPARTGLLQRKCACGGTPGPTGECAECRKKRLQRQSTGRLEPSPVPLVTHETLDLPARPSNPDTHAPAERGFGHDFGNVKVHPGEKVAGSARGIDQGNPEGTLSRALLSTGTSGGGLLDDAKEADGAGCTKMTADIVTVRHPVPQAAAMISDSGEADVEDETGVKFVAQSDAGVPRAPADAGTPAPPAAPAPAPAPAPAAPAAPTCTYSVTYANQTTPACTGGRCGAQMIYDITEVRATGSGCPATLDGLMLTEVVTNDHGCVAVDVRGGAGCRINSHPPMLPGYGQLRGCTDTYALCGPAAVFPAAGCTETVTQQLFVGRALAETRTIRFNITRPAGGCSGTATRT